MAALRELLSVLLGPAGPPARRDTFRPARLRAVVRLGRPLFPRRIASRRLRSRACRALRTD